jgi:hypothetical protein
VANGPGNGNGQGEDNGNGLGEQGSQPTPANGPGVGKQHPSPPQSAALGSGNDNGEGDENGPGAPLLPAGASSVLGSTGFGSIPSEVAAEASASEALAETLVSDESIALGAFVREGEVAVASLASPGNAASPGAAEDERVSVPEVGSGSASGGTPLLMASPTPSMPFAAFVTGLQQSSPTNNEFKLPALYAQINDLDKLFLEWWDDDQLLFPDSLPPIDESLFPDVMPQRDDMLLPNDMLVPNEIPSGEDVSLDLKLLSQPPVATVGKEHVLPFDVLPRGNGWRESAIADPDSAEESVARASIRPYHIALGMLPFLVAFGYTPSTLREHVHAGRRIWKRLRSHLRRRT